MVQFQQHGVRWVAPGPRYLAVGFTSGTVVWSREDANGQIDPFLETCYAVEGQFEVTQEIGGQLVTSMLHPGEAVSFPHGRKHKFVVRGTGREG